MVTEIDTNNITVHLPTDVGAIELIREALLDLIQNYNYTDFGESCIDTIYWTTYLLKHLNQIKEDK